MPKVTGIGGIFFRADASKELKAWYAARLGIEPDSGGHVAFPWRPVDDHRGDHPYGRFAWVTDPEGHRIDLWEPPARPIGSAS